jgi:serine/threonine protein kinase
MLPEMPGRIGRYEIDRRIGSGGMALTYRCRLEGLGGFSKKVVVKVLHPDHVGEESYLRMFLDEARISAGLHHANIAQVFEVGSDHGIPYMVMEFVNGPNLASITRRIGPFGARPYGLIAHLLAGIARGLDHAHSQVAEDGSPLGLVHRDVSLGNIVVSREGVPKLIDFGIAKWNNRSSITEVGMLKGKLHYMAPEQLSGQADHFVDIYQLGVCLYWLSTGRPPFHHEDPAEIWKMRLAGAVPRPTQLIDGYPVELEEIVLAALATDPERRWSSASELADMLEAFCFSHPMHAASDDTVSEWIRSLVPSEEFEEPSSRVHLSHASGRPSIGELMSESVGARVAPVEISELDEGPSEVTLRPEPAPVLQPWVVALVSSVISVAMVMMLALGLGIVATGSSADEAAGIYFDEAQRMVDAGDIEGAGLLVDRALAADPTDPDLVVRITRMQRSLRERE